jgi:hypothetical protein
MHLPFLPEYLILVSASLKVVVSFSAPVFEAVIDTIGKTGALRNCEN